jgi:hypothetical protein
LPWSFAPEPVVADAPSLLVLLSLPPHAAIPMASTAPNAIPSVRLIPLPSSMIRKYS